MCILMYDRYGGCGCLLRSGACRRRHGRGAGAPSWPSAAASSSPPSSDPSSPSLARRLRRDGPAAWRRPCRAALSAKTEKGLGFGFGPAVTTFPAPRHRQGFGGPRGIRSESEVRAAAAAALGGTCAATAAAAAEKGEEEDEEGEDGEDSHAPAAAAAAAAAAAGGDCQGVVRRWRWARRRGSRDPRVAVCRYHRARWALNGRRRVGGGGLWARPARDRLEDFLAGRGREAKSAVRDEEMRQRNTSYGKP